MRIHIEYSGRNSPKRDNCNPHRAELMIFKRLRQKHSTGHLRMRIESCVNIVLDMNKSLGEGKIKPEIVQQFERLKESLQHVRDDQVDEDDINRIEQATNELLAEIRIAYEGKPINNLYKGQTH